MKYLFCVSLLFLCLESVAQSGRTTPPNSQTDATGVSQLPPVKKLFDEANAYSKNKFAEFAAKKIQYNEGLEKQTEREKKQLAAKYASHVQSRSDLKGDDLYYLGLLHWIAENLDG